MAADSPHPELNANHQEGSFVNPRNFTIFTQRWIPHETPTATLVIAHGLGEHSSRYIPLVKHFLGHNFAVFAIDHEAHGRSQGQHQYVESVQHMVDDLNTYATAVHAEYPNLTHFLLGHSMGGCISLTLTMQHPNMFHYVIISAPATIPPPSVGPVLRFGARILAVIAPKSRPSPLNLTTLCRDPTVVQTYLADPLVWHEAVAAGLGNSIMNYGADLISHAHNYTTPLLIMQGTEDEVIGPEGTRIFFDHCSSADKTFLGFNGMYHEILNEPEKEQVWDLIVEWMKERLALKDGASMATNSAKTYNIVEGKLVDQ